MKTDLLMEWGRDLAASFVLSFVALFIDLVAPPELVAGGWAIVLLLQTAAGIAVIHLARSIGGGRIAVFAAGLLYCVTALHHEAPAAAGLPIMLLAIERARTRPGWVLIALGMLCYARVDGARFRSLTLLWRFCSR